MIKSQIVSLNYIVTGNFNGSEILTAPNSRAIYVVCADKFYRQTPLTVQQMTGSKFVC